MQSLHSCASISSRNVHLSTPTAANHNQHHLGNNCIEAVVRKVGSLWFNNDNFMLGCQVTFSFQSGERHLWTTVRTDIVNFTVW